MKKILLLFSALTVLFVSYASFVVEPPKKASEIFIPINTSGQKISLQELATISPKQFEALSGKDLKFFDKISFKLAQRQLRNSINEDGTLNSKKLEKLGKKMAEGTDGFHIGGFALGFLVGLIGVLIAYLINDDKKSTRVRWAWIGFGAALVLYLLLLLI